MKWPWVSRKRPQSADGGPDGSHKPTAEQVAWYIKELPGGAEQDLSRADHMERCGAPAWAFCYRLALLACIELTRDK